MKDLKYPKFVWVTACVILAAVVSVAVSQQAVKEIEFLGFVFRFFAPEKAEQAVTFSIYSGTADGAPASGRGSSATRVRMNGQVVAYLVTEPGRSFDSATVTLPTPGEYAYEIEEVAVTIDGTKLHLWGNGKVKVDHGAGFRIVLHNDPSTGLRPILDPVRTKEEERARQGTAEELDAIMKKEIDAAMKKDRRQ